MNARPWRTWAMWRRLTAGAFLGLLILGSMDWFPWFRGSISTTRLLEAIPFADPLAAIEVTLASREPNATLLLGALIVVSIAILLGPVFCGFICPLGLLLDLNQTARRLFRRAIPRKRGHEPVPVGVPRWIKFVMLGVFIGLSVTAQLPVFQAFSPINLLARAIIFGSMLGLSVVLVLMIAEWFIPRVWCRALCPLGALYTLIGRAGLLRVRINQAQAARRGCHRCTAACPMGIPVMEDYAQRGRLSVTHPDCIRCGDCADVCPRSMLSLRFRNDRASRGDNGDPGAHHLPVVLSGEVARGSCGLEPEDEASQPHHASRA